jgi:hypothetical protein
LFIGQPTSNAYQQADLDIWESAHHSRCSYGCRVVAMPSRRKASNNHIMLANTAQDVQVPIGFNPQ